MRDVFEKWALSRSAPMSVVVVLAISSMSSAAGGTSSLLEITQKGHKYRGKLAAKGSNACWLLARDGRLSAFDIDQIDSIRTVAPRYREYSAAELRDQLRRELPKNFRIDATGHFLVCAEKNNRRFGEICEDTYRTFHRYFSVSGFKISEPSFPLVAIVFPDRASFAEYCHKDGLDPPNGMLGYYMRLTNRTALYDTGERGTSPSSARRSTEPQSLAEVFRPEERRDVRLETIDRFSARPALPFDAMVDGNLQNTIVHETTHQAAFNTGLHSRIGQTPKWVIEGLATMFEAPGIRDAKSAAPRLRINRNRFLWFGNYAKSRRKPESLQDFVATDDLYASAALDAYAEGWALTFFLAETRHGSYARYLKSTAQRDPLKPYPAGERLADFKKAFGNVNTLETEYLRFIENLK